MLRLHLAVLSLCFGWCLSAQDTLRISPLTVTAPAWVSPTGADTRPATTFGPAELDERYFGQEPATLLARAPGVTAYTDAGSPFGYAYLRLRGIDQTRLNFTLDGVPINEPEDQGFYFNNYADLLSSVRAIQVQPGVNVGVNGTAAFGGSVHLLTPALGGDDFTELTLGGGSYGGYRASAALGRTGAGGWSTYARATALGANGYKRDSDHAAQSVFLQTGRAGERDLLKFTFFGGRQTNGMAWLGVPDSVLQEDPRANYNDPDERDAFTTTLAKVNYVRFLSAKTTWNTSVYYGFQNGNYDFDLDNFLEQERNFGVFNYAFGYHNLGVLSNLRTELGAWRLEGGIHAQRHRREHVGSIKDGDELYVNVGRKADLSAFTAVGRDLGKLSLRGALQLRYVAFDYEGAVALPTQDHTFANVEFSASYPVGPGRFYYRFGHVGREPTRNDLFAGEDDLLSVNGMPALGVTEPEFVSDHEFGYTGAARDFTYAINAFYLDFRDEITLSGAFGPNGLPLRASVARSYRAGLELGLTRTFSDRFSATLNGAWMRSRIEQDDVSIEPVLTPDLTLQPGVTYRRGDWFLGLDGRYQSASFIDLANDYALDDFVTLDLRAGWAKGRWAVSGYLFNVGDAAYSTNGQLNVFGRPTYHRQAGRNGWLSLTYRW